MVGLSANGERAVASNIADGTIALFRVASGDTAATIRVAAQPEGIAISPDGAWAWAGSNRDSVVTVIDLAAKVVRDTLRGFGLPYRLAVTPDGKRVVITDPAKSEVRIVDAATRRALHTVVVSRDSLLGIAEIPGSPSPEGVAVSRDSRWAFVTLQGRNRVATIDLDKGVIVALAPTGNWSDGVGYSTLVSR